MARSTTWALAEGLVPTMTSDTTPSGECSASSVYQSYNAYLAFDGNITDNGWVATGNTDCWIQYKFENPIKVNHVSLIPRNSSGNSGINNFKVQGSNDGNVFEDIYTGKCNGTVGSYQRFTFNNDNHYLYYRIHIVDIYSGATYCGITSLQFYSDADITTSQDAMSLIGKYDYCSNVLLSNATWAAAIGNSEYFEEIIVPLIPTMTSNTTPSGICSASSEYNTTSVPYKAVDGVATTSEFDAWISARNESEKWWQYMFESPNIVNRMYISGRKYTKDSNGQITSFVLKGSNDGTNWTDLTETIDRSSVGKGVRTYHNINNTVAYKYYRVGDIPDSIPGIGELQFYGRASAQTNIIHSAANDTIYMKKDGSPVVLTTTDSNGVGTIDFTQFDDGVTYTLYSSVAKDPNNQSNDYSKNIRVTKSKYGCTTEAYLIPDPVKTLYWYGCRPYEYNKNNITFNTNTFTVDYRSGSAKSWFMPVSKFNISNYSKYHILTGVNGLGYCAAGLYDTPQNRKYTIVRNCYKNAYYEGDLSSYSGEYYVGVSENNGLSTYDETGYVDIAALWLE